jgi:hypothetical protein
MSGAPRGGGKEVDKETLRRQYDRDLRSAELSLQPQWEDVTAAAQF